MEIYLIRHTKPLIKAGICYGQTDMGLARGFKARAIKIKKEIPTGITVFTSPLMRCSLLAEAICDQPIADQRLMELNFGLWELKPWKDIAASEPWFEDFIHRKVPGGESYTDLFNRVNWFMKALSQSGLQQAAIVTHGGVLKTINAIHFNLSLDQAINQVIPFGAVQKLAFNDDFIQFSGFQKKYLAAMKRNLLLIATLMLTTLAKAQVGGQMIRDWERAKTYTLHYLQAMPEENYSFKPAPGTRTFEEHMLHFTDANFELAPLAGGLKSPMEPGAAEKSIDKSKAATIKMVMAGYDFVISNIRNMKPEQFQDTIKVFDKYVMTKGTLLNKIFEHQTHHRGQTAIYFRLKGIAPPNEELF